MPLGLPLLDLLGFFCRGQTGLELFRRSQIGQQFLGPSRVVAREHAGGYSQSIQVLEGGCSGGSESLPDQGYSHGLSKGRDPNPTACPLKARF